MIIKRMPLPFPLVKPSNVERNICERWIPDSGTKTKHKHFWDIITISPCLLSKGVLSQNGFIV